MSKCLRYKFKVLDEEFVDEYSNSYPDIADSLLNSASKWAKLDGKKVWK